MPRHAKQGTRAKSIPSLICSSVIILANNLQPYLAYALRRRKQVCVSDLRRRHPLLQAFQLLFVFILSISSFFCSVPITPPASLLHALESRTPLSPPVPNNHSSRASASFSHPSQRPACISFRPTETHGSQRGSNPAVNYAFSSRRLNIYKTAPHSPFFLYLTRRTLV